MRFAVAPCVALALALIRCSTSLPHPAYVAQPTSALVEASRVPPPSRVEMVPPRPDDRSVWIDGEWTWRRGRWSWLVGRWVLAPSGARFSPWAFVRAPDGTLWVAAGTWRNVNGAPVEAPRALAVASVESVEVVDAEGRTEVTGPTLSERPGTPSGPAD